MTRTLKGHDYTVTGSASLLRYRKDGALTAYRVTPYGCSCPAWPKPCKHMRDAREVTTPNQQETQMTQLPAVLDSQTTDIIPLLGQIDGFLRMGTMLIKSGMLPKSIATPEAAVVIMIQARELGIGMMEGFRSINVIQGKPTIAPQLMIALAEHSGALQDYRIEDDGKQASCTVIRRGRSPYTATFSMEDAKSLKLSDKDNWKSQAKVMRQWRAVSAAFRVVFADVLAGIYIPEEMGAATNADGEMIALPVHAPTVSQPVATGAVSDAEINRIIGDTPNAEIADVLDPPDDSWREKNAASMQKRADELIAALKPGVGVAAIAEILGSHGIEVDGADILNGVIAADPNLFPDPDTAVAVYREIGKRMPSKK